MRHSRRFVAAAAVMIAALTSVVSLAACDRGGPAQPSPAASPSSGAAVTQLGPRLDAGLGFRQDESGLIVVHLLGDAAEMRRQASELLANEIAAYKAAVAKNTQIDAPSAGSGYAVWNAGQLWTGSTFDSAGLGAQDRYRVVYVVRPTGGIPFVCVSWPAADAAEWVRSAMNSAGISLSYFRVAANGESATGVRALWHTLASVIARARTIDQAVAMLAAAPRSANANIVIGDGRQQRAVVVELTPQKLVVRRSGDVIWATDQFATASLRSTIRDESSTSRYLRLGALIGGGPGRFTPALAVAILRDHVNGVTGSRSLSGDVIASYANVQAEVFNPTKGSFWIASGEAPAVYGAWAGFNLAEEIAGRPSAARVMALPTDPVLSLAENAGFRSFEQGYVAYLSGDLSTAISSLGAAVQSEPKNGVYRLTFGLALLAAGKATAAATQLHAAIGDDLDAQQKALAYLKLGAIYKAAGESEQSLAAYRAVLTLKTNVATLEAPARAALAAPGSPTPTATPTPSQTPTPTPTRSSEESNAGHEAATPEHRAASAVEPAPGGAREP
jgi:hypothetical protein